MTLDITKVQFASTIDTFKNEDSVSGSISVPSQSYTAGQFRSFTSSIDFGRADSSQMVLQNYSFDSGKYYLGEYIQVDVDANFTAQTRMYRNGGILYITVFVVNQTGSTVTVPAFILTVSVRRYVTPYD